LEGGAMPARSRLKLTSDGRIGKSTHDLAGTATRKRWISIFLLALFLVFADTSRTLAYEADPDLVREARRMDRKYFPVFLDTVHMLQEQDFTGLGRYFKPGFLAAPGLPGRRNISIRDYRPGFELYYALNRVPLHQDPDGKGFRITFPVDWNADPMSNNTWVLFFQNLSWLEAPLGEGEKGNAEAMLSSFLVIQDWLDANIRWPVESASFIFNDHAVSARLEVFCRALRLYDANAECEDRSFRENLLAGILNHIALLASHEVYLDWHNHGIIADKSLLQALDLCEGFRMREEVRSFALRRLEAQFDFAFTGEGVHREHSPCYHDFVVNLLLQCLDLIGDDNGSVTSSLRALARRASDFYVYILRPDGTFPGIGDCTDHSECTLSEAYLEESPQLRWVISRGSEGTAPSRTAKVFEESGWAIFRDKWPAEIYAVVQSDFNSFGHYQEDDTSILISAYGRDLIIDTGLHGYNKDPFDEYMRKSRAHNVLIVDETDFNFDLKNTGLSGITRSVDENSRESGRGVAVELTHPHYDSLGVKVYRAVGSIDATSFVVRDRIETGNTHDYTQLYHFAPGAEVLEIEKGILRVSWGGHDVVVWLSSGYECFDIVQGELDPLQGWYFPRFAVSRPEPVVRLRRRGESTDFQTVIAITRGEEAPAWEVLLPSAKTLLELLEAQPRKQLARREVPRKWRPSRKL